MDTMLGDLDNATAYLDDILVTRAPESYNKRIREVTRIRVKVKEAKSDFFLPEIKYLGHMINRDGRRPDPERANAIRNMPAQITFKPYKASSA